MKSRAVLYSLLIAAFAAGAFLMWKAKQQGGLGAAALKHTEEILAFGPRPAGSKELAKVRELLKTKLQMAGWNVTEQSFSRYTPEGEIQFVNLRARFPGTAGGNVWERKVRGVLCAHADSKLFKNDRFVGADDAASACGAIVEIASVLAKTKPEQAAALELVFFDGEEAFVDFSSSDGLFGSRHYANEWRSKPDKPEFGILLDMIGHQNLKIRLPSDSPEKLRNLALESAKREKAPSGTFDLAPGTILDDHVPLNFAGIPTVNLLGDFWEAPWWHHQRGGRDDRSILSAESLDLSMRVTLRMLDQLLGGH